jgi:hypothetical protein
MLHCHGFDVVGRASKTVSDALREEAAAMQYPSDDALWDVLFGQELGEDRR